VSTETVTIDVLHALDLGFSQDLIGNVVWEYSEHFAAGGTQSQRMAYVFVKLKEHYMKMRTTNRLQALTVEMVRSEASKSPKMRTKGAETRNLVPFAVEIAMEMCETRLGPRFKGVLRRGGGSLGEGVLF